MGTQPGLGRAVSPAGVVAGGWCGTVADSPCPRPQVLYERELSLRTMFLFMAACSAWHLLRTLFLMPRSRIPYPLPPAYDYG